MRLLLALVVLQAACVSSSIELAEEPSDAGPPMDAGPRMDGGGGVQDAALDALDGCQSSVAPPIECYRDCTVVPAEWNQATCEFECEEPAAECFTRCDPVLSICSVGFQCCDGEECDLIARNEAGYDQLCDPDLAPLEYGAACVENKCQVVDFGSCDDGDSCVVALNTNDACGEAVINDAFFSEYVDFICATNPDCCESIVAETGAAFCNEVRVCEAE
ncbi:MAG: hypothetical protein AB8H86_18005 [Polyangiales bacterium]